MHFKVSFKFPFVIYFFLATTMLFTNPSSEHILAVAVHNHNHHLWQHPPHLLILHPIAPSQCNTTWMPSSSFLDINQSVTHHSTSCFCTISPSPCTTLGPHHSICWRRYCQTMISMDRGDMMDDCISDRLPLLLALTLVSPLPLPSLLEDYLCNCHLILISSLRWLIDCIA